MPSPSESEFGRPGDAALRHMGVRTEFESDGKWRNWWVEIMTSHNLRDLLGVLLALAYVASNDEDSTAQALCVLIDSKITDKRLNDELAMFHTAVRPALASRIHVCFYRGRGELKTQIHPGPGFDGWLGELVRHQDRRELPHRCGRAEAIESAGCSGAHQ